MEVSYNKERLFVIKRPERNNEMIEYNIGILGAGNIAAVIADVLKNMNGFCPYAIASRDEQKAKDFAEKYGIEKAYGSYEELMADPEVELVYIATVNTNHAELAKKCMDAGKPVFIEKPISYNSRTAAELFQYAEEKGLFCGEAMWLRYNPLMNMVVDLVKKNAIGDVRSITANIGYNLVGKERILNPALAGGALLDIGVYPLTAVFMIMGGPPSQVIATPITTNTGVDAFSTILMGYPQGRNAYVTTTVTAKLDNRCVIYGTHGRIEINNVNNPSQVTIYGADGQNKGELVPQDDAKTGYEYEFKAARKAAIAGNLETTELTRKDIIELYKFIDTIRYTWNLPFPLPGEPEKRVQKPETSKEGEPNSAKPENTENA